MWMRRKQSYIVFLSLAHIVKRPKNIVPSRYTRNRRGYLHRILQCDTQSLKLSRFNQLLRDEEDEKYGRYYRTLL